MVANRHYAGGKCMLDRYCARLEYDLEVNYL
jgi:hypothetical protein